jgi:hypothetical protein
MNFYETPFFLLKYSLFSIVRIYYIILYYSMFIVFPIKVYSLPYVVLGFLLTAHCLSINRDLCNIVIMNKTQYNVVNFSLPLFLFSIYFFNIFYIVSKLFNMVSKPLSCGLQKMSLTFSGVLHVFYDCFIIPVVHMPPLTFKIVVSLFHTSIAATSGKTIPESGLQGPDLMIWGRSAADDSRMRLHTRPMALVTVPIDISGDAHSRAAEITFIRL